MALGLVFNTQAPFYMAQNWHSFADDMIMGMCYNVIVNNCV